jgi:KDO2-lipid IV(A) palmitoleoyltransferase
MVDNIFSSLGIALAETGIAWFWSDRAVKKLFDISGLHYLKLAKMKNHGVMIIGLHFMSLELSGRIIGMCQPIVGVYRPHNNDLIEWVQNKGRMRSNKNMIDRRNLRGVVRSLENKEFIWFAPDHDYGPRGSIFAPFFAVEHAATTNGTFVISKLTKPTMLAISLIRQSGNKRYQLIISPELKDYPYNDKMSAAIYMNKVIEEQILLAPEQYLWLHRRFKTRPPGEDYPYA